MCFTLFPDSRNLIFAPLFKRNISRTFNFFLRNHLFAQQLCAKIRCARKFSELSYLIGEKFNFLYYIHVTFLTTTTLECSGKNTSGGEINRGKVLVG